MRFLYFSHTNLQVRLLRSESTKDLIFYSEQVFTTFTRFTLTASLKFLLLFRRSYRFTYRYEFQIFDSDLLQIPVMKVYERNLIYQDYHMRNIRLKYQRLTLLKILKNYIYIRIEILFNLITLFIRNYTLLKRTHRKLKEDKEVQKFIFILFYFISLNANVILIA